MIDEFEQCFASVRFQLDDICLKGMLDVFGCYFRKDYQIQQQIDLNKKGLFLILLLFN